VLNEITNVYCQHNYVYSILSGCVRYTSDTQTYSGEVPVFDRVVSGVRVVVVIAESLDATVLVAGIQSDCKNHTVLT
jgi:hypothetical protein